MLETDAPPPSVFSDWLLSEHGRDSVASKPKSVQSVQKEECIRTRLAHSYAGWFDLTNIRMTASRDCNMQQRDREAETVAGTPEPHISTFGHQFMAVDCYKICMLGKALPLGSATILLQVGSLK